MEKKESSRTPITAPLKIGERIGISLDGELLHPTLLEDIREDNRLVISVPLYRGLPIIMKVEQQVQFFFFRENGRFCIDVQVEEITMHGPVRLIVLIPLSEPLKQQRRNAFRLRICLSGLIRPLNGNNFLLNPFFEEEDLSPWEEVFTNNLSECGISLNSIVHHKNGDCLHIKLTLDHTPDHSEQIDLLGIIRRVQVIKHLGTQYRLGVEFLPYSENMRLIIVKFMLKKQQQIIRTELESY